MTVGFIPVLPLTGVQMAEDFRKYYNLDALLVGGVSAEFNASGKISPLDFFLILVWKANRKADQQKRRLATKANGSFQKAVESIAKCLWELRTSPKLQMKFLMEDWAFRWPTASAILSVLSPENFTVYDFRVCDELELELEGRSFHGLANKRFSDATWKQYQDFVQAVVDVAPHGLSLRDKDRFLWGRSFHREAIAKLDS
jgi:hypothetical protein